MPFYVYAEENRTLLHFRVRKGGLMHNDRIYKTTQKLDHAFVIVYRLVHRMR